MLLLLPSAHFLCANPIRILPFLSSPFKPWRHPRFAPMCRRLETPSSGTAEPVLLDSLRVLEWDKLCDCVASFASTPLGRQATMETLRPLDVTFVESKHLLSETAAAVEMLKYGIGGVDFSGIDVVLVKSAIEHALRGYPIKGTEALAVATLIQYAEILQTSLKAVLKEGEDSHKRFMPLTEVILELVLSPPLVKMIHKVIDEEGCVKDSASPEVKRLRDQVRSLEKKLYQLMDKLVRNESSSVSLMEATVVSGRWCIKTVTDRQTEFEGLLLSSGSGLECVVEPLIAVPLNDELQQTRSLVAKAEENVLSQLTDKILTEIDAIQKLLGMVIELDVIFARAKYSVSYEGVFPDLYLSKNKDELFAAETDSSAIKTSSGTFHLPIKGKWKFLACKAYHPLLLHQHEQNLQRARKEVTTAESEIRRARTQGMDVRSRADTDLPSLRLKVEKLEKERPIPVDLVISQKTNVLIITGPNTGGKTITLKTIGLVSLMAKSGLYVLASEPVQLPWFDAIFADIGDEQSLLQSLSTFSGHLKQITAIRSKSTSQSLVLLDEIGAGTNPLEGAALGMSLLESFAEGGALLTVATTHHGELKTLKYRNYSFENACVEFDEVKLRPTYKILWGVPGRSNATNIAEKLGLPNDIVDKARRLYGVTSAEINEVITDMETFKQDFQHDLQEAQNYLMMSRENYRNLLVTNDKIHEHNTTLRAKRTQAVLDVAARSRSALRNMLRQFRESTVQATEYEKEDRNARSVEHLPQELSTSTQVGYMQPPSSSSSTTTTTTTTQTTEKHVKIPEKGDMVLVRSLGKKAMVLKVESSKGEIVVQANNMKLRLKLSEVGV